MGWLADWKANRDLDAARGEVQRARSPWAIAQFIEKCLELKKFEVALEEAERGIQEFPASEALTEAYKRMIRTKCEDDLKQVRLEVKTSPGPKAYYRAACLYKEMRDLDQAIDMARKGAELYPNFEGNYIVLADIRYERFQRDLRASDGLEAISLFEKAVDLNRENYRLLFQLAEIYTAVGARDQALEKVNMILEFAPDDRKALGMLDQIQKLKQPKSSDVKEVLLDFERRAGGAMRRAGQIAQRYMKSPDHLARKLPTLERIVGFQRAVVLGPAGELLAAYPGNSEENRKYAEVMKRNFTAAIECSLRMEISTFEKGMFESSEGFTYLIMADRLMVAVLCSSKAKKEKIEEDVHRFVEHELYL